MTNLPDSKGSPRALTDDVTFAITADAGELEVQARSLVQSIGEACPQADIVVFIPAQSRSHISDSVLNLFESVGTVSYGQIPIQEYPISALLRAFVEAERITETEYLAALDTDTLLLQPIRIDNRAEVWLRPADVGAQYWCSADASDDWETLYERFDLEPPGRDEYITASVDKRTIPPYWNSGVVITTDRTLPSRWLSYTETLFNDEDLSVPKNEFFLDQISLSLAVRENVVSELDEVANFPLGGRVFVPENVSVLHYGDRRNLTRVLPLRARREVAEFGITPPISGAGIVRSLLDITSTKSGRLLTYKSKRRVRQIVRTMFPNSVVNA